MSELLKDEIIRELFKIIRKSSNYVTFNSILSQGLLNESHPRDFQTITLFFFIAFKAMHCARLGLVRQG